MASGNANTNGHLVDVRSCSFVVHSTSFQLLVTSETILRTGRHIQDENAFVTHAARTNAVVAHGVLACRMCTFVAAGILLHVIERRIVVTVGTQGETLQ
jgi:hypothetical protein